MITRLFCLSFALAFTLPDSAIAQIYFVDAGATPGGNGASWASAFDSLQDALDVAGPGEQVWVAEGRYAPDEGASVISGDRSATFELPSGVAVYGGFLGTELILGARAGLAENTLLTGDLANDDQPGGMGLNENSLHVLTATGGTSATRLEGFTIERGNATGLGDDAMGGALLARLGTQLRVANCVFRNNRALLDGGAVFNAGNANPVFEDCLFDGNLAMQDGGAVMCVTDCMPQFLRCQFEANTAGRFGGAAGNSASALPQFADCLFSGNVAANAAGALWSDNASITVNACSFNDNEAALLGGAIFCTGSPVLRDCQFARNEAMRGGALYVLAIFSNPELERCVFVDNTATLEGGALFSSGNPTLTGCTFARNTTPGWGGAVRTGSSGKEPTFIDCVFRANQAFRGGAVANSGVGTSRFARCRFTENYASEWGGAIYHGEAVLELQGCTFGENRALLKGGGVFLNNLVSGATIDDCLFHHCEANSVGGGLYITNSSSPVVTDCTFTHNLAQVHGGGVYNISSEDAGGVSSGRFERCVFDSNTSRQDGGGFFNTTSAVGGECNPVLVDCLFNANTATKDGAGFYNIAFGGTSSPALFGVEFLGNACGLNGAGFHNTATSNQASTFCRSRLTNCVFSGNRARGNGGAFFNDNHSEQPGDSDSTLSNCVLSENRALHQGGGIYNGSAANGQSNLSIENSILWGNRDAGGTDESAQLADLAGTASCEYSCVEGLTAGGPGCVSVTPLFLDARGGDGVAGTCDDDLRLATNSPLIDAASNFLVPADQYDIDADGSSLELLPVSFDLTDRFVDFSTPDTGSGWVPLIDMGPFEAADCDANGINDAEDVFLGAADCNGNHIPDVCELALADGGLCATNCSTDTDGNGVLDECEPAPVVTPGRGRRTSQRPKAKARLKKLRPCSLSLRKP